MSGPENGRSLMSATHPAPWFSSITAGGNILFSVSVADPLAKAFDNAAPVEEWSMSCFRVDQTFKRFCRNSFHEPVRSIWS